MSDKSLAAVCSDAMLKPGVAGVLVVDAQGLLLASDGAVPEAAARSPSWRRRRRRSAATTRA